MENVHGWIVGIIGIVVFTGLLSILISIFFEYEYEVLTPALPHTRNKLSTTYLENDPEEYNEPISNKDIIVNYENLESEIFNL